jgi:hypothetical protein
MMLVVVGKWAVCLCTFICRRSLTTTITTQYACIRHPVTVLQMGLDYVCVYVLACRRCLTTTTTLTTCWTLPMRWKATAPTP